MTVVSSSYRLISKNFVKYVVLMSSTTIWRNRQRKRLYAWVLQFTWYSSLQISSTVFLLQKVCIFITCFCKQALLLKDKICEFDDVEKVNIRLYNYADSTIALKNLKAAYIGCSHIVLMLTLSLFSICCNERQIITSSNIAGRLVSVRGTVVKVSTVKPLVVQMGFECGKCRTHVSRIFPDGKFMPPTGCIMYGCRSKTFVPIRSSAKPIDFQRIRHAVVRFHLSFEVSLFVASI